MLQLKPSVRVLTLFVLAGYCTLMIAEAETVPIGTEFVIELERTVQPQNPSDSKNNGKNASKGDDRFYGKLAFPVFANGQEMVPLGTRIEGEIRGNKKEVFLSPRKLILPGGKEVDFAASVTKVNNQRLQAEENEGTIQEKGGNAGPAAQQAGEVGVTGAVIGAVTTGSAEGAGIGAAAGVAAVLIGRELAGRKHSSTEIPAGTQLTLSLEQPLEIPDSVEAAAQSATEPGGSFEDRQDARPVLRRDDAPAPASEQP